MMGVLIALVERPGDVRGKMFGAVGDIKWVVASLM
jgi:hypothetical protein